MSNSNITIQTVKTFSGEATADFNEYSFPARIEIKLNDNTVVTYKQSKLGKIKFETLCYCLENYTKRDDCKIIANRFINSNK